MTSSFYRSFEDRYRGSRELIIERQMVYLPFISPLKQLHEACSAVDLGCGRGEWLEILSRQGFEALGIDLDQGMLDACDTLGLATRKQDVLEALRGLADESQVLVSGFHIVEHIPFADLQELVTESLRILKPGGLLILETPNPENLVVGTNNFYLDPTHERPIPHLLLGFLTEYSGFSRSKLLRLQTSLQLLENEATTLFDVLGGTSPDYAIVAQKHSEQGMLAFDEAFGSVHGLALDELAVRYDAGLDQKIRHVEETSALEVRALQAALADGNQAQFERTQALNEALAQSHGTLEQLSSKLEQAIAYAAALEYRVSQLEIRADLAETSLHNLHAKRSQPLSAKIKQALRPHLIVAARNILGNPALRKGTGAVLRTFPALHKKMQSFAKNNGFLPRDEAQEPFTSGPYIAQATSAQMSLAAFPQRPLVPESLFLEALDATADFSCVRFTGHIEGHYSLAIVNRGLATALSSQLEDHLRFVPYHGKLYGNPTEIPASQLGLLDALNVELNEPNLDRILSIVHHYPMISDAEPSGLRTVLFFWEETAVPHGTVAHLNEHFDAVFVATAFVKKVLQDSGCTAIVLVCPIGIDHLINDSVPPIATLKPEEGAPFRFLHISSMFERKGPDVLIAAYLDEFTAQDNVELFIKTFPNPHNRVHDLVAELSAGRDNLPAIIIDQAHINDEQMVALYRSAQTMVLPTRGEGFNLPAAEALAMALPLIVTGYGAHTDFCTNTTASLLPFSFARSESHLRSVDACWVEPDKASLALQMRETLRQVLNQDVELETRREEGLRHVRSTYTWDKSARAVLASAGWAKRALSEAALSQEPPRKTRLTLISPWATRCGVAEYTQSLLSELSADTYDMSIFCDMRTDADPAQLLYQPTWALGDTGAVKRTLEREECLQCDVLMVQHQPSLFKLDDELCHLLAKRQKEGAVVILELHSTLPLIAEHRISESGLQSLRTLDRIIVHKPEDLNNLLVLGLVDNVTMIGLGVIQPLPEGSADNVRPALGLTDDALVIACFGFILPHKGIDTLIESILPLAAASGRNVHMLGLHSILDARSEQTLNAYRARARELGVESSITWITDYLPINECLRTMSAADYVIFPYKETQESASAAVTIGLATLKPVLVSPIHIFSDLADVTWRMGGSRADDIVASIMHLEADPQLRAGLVERQTSWTQERSWTRISPRLNNLLHSLLTDRKLSLAVAPRRRDRNQPAEAGQTPKLYVDVSELYFRDAKTGIQRVVKNVFHELQLSQNGQYEVVPVFGVSGHGYRYASKYPGTSDFVISRNEQPVSYGPGDIFLGLDLSAHLYPEFDLELERMKRARMKVYFVVYDLIPLLYPRFVYPGVDKAFTGWIRSLGQHADGLIAISNAVATDVRNWLIQREGLRAIPYVDYFHLGADIENIEPSAPIDSQHDPLIHELKLKPSFLMVGTLEPRKGHEQTLSAFEQLWKAGIDVNLVLVGKEGWAVDELVQRIRSHPMLSKRLFWLAGINDSTLTKVYESCCCLVASSEAEGFGLPLIEAAQHGMPIIARDIPVFREVAADNASYFNGLGPQPLAETITDWLKRYDAGTQPSSENLKWLHWTQSVEMLKKIIIGAK